MSAARLLVAVSLAAVLLAACSAPQRDPLSVQAIAEGQDAYVAEREAFRARSFERVLARADAVASGATADDTIDILALSGGADWGAFGAGYLARWHELGDDAHLPMPEFDIIGGISTGSLIGTYVAAGTAERYAGIESFYRRTSPDWVVFPGVARFLPNGTSIFDNSGVREQVALAVDDRLVAELRAAHADYRTVIAATTNLDFGTLDYWELGEEATAIAEPHERITSVLMAATAIPGAFPPVEIDGRLHADGGAVQGVPAIDPAQLPAFAAAWRQVYGDRPLPVIRFWMIYNNQLGLQPHAVGLAWYDIVFRSYQTISQTAFKAPLQTSLLTAQAGGIAGMPRYEVRWVAIPSTYVADPEALPFDPAVTNALADLGREVAEQPDGGWRTDYPE